eukprot:scaffold5345_cov86-Cylindrotheca_fusiformis.AAC.5
MATQNKQRPGIPHCSPMKCFTNRHFREMFHRLSPSATVSSGSSWKIWTICFHVSKRDWRSGLGHMWASLIMKLPTLVARLVDAYHSSTPSFIDVDVSVKGRIAIMDHEEEIFEPLNE